MGEVVQLRPQPQSEAWARWVETICILAGHPERASTYISRGLPRARIVAELRTLMAGRRGPEGEAAYLDQLRGPCRSDRRSRPIRIYPHGIRRPAHEDTVA